MTLYRCRIHGKNFPGEILRLKNPVGFVTTRFVEADSREEAELAALARLKEDPALALARQYHNPDARVFFEWIEEVPPNTERAPDAGFTFYASPD